MKMKRLFKTNFLFFFYFFIEIKKKKHKPLNRLNRGFSTVETEPNR